MTTWFDKGPNALYRNLPIRADYFSPRKKFINTIVLGKETTIVTDGDHEYVVGQLVRLLVPSWYGSYQLSGISGYVTAVPTSSSVIINIDSRQANPFIANPAYSTTRPQIVAVGDLNTPYLNSSGPSSYETSIPGSFINISPQ